jgi:hypothetical protein
MKVFPKLSFFGGILLISAVLGLSAFGGTDTSNEDLWRRAERNGEQARRAFLRCRDYVRGWMAHADPKSGLIPRNLNRDPFWNAQDAAADNYPFMVLTSALLDRTLFGGEMRAMLEAERRLTSRVGPLPDDFLFETQSFRHNEVDMVRIIFGASEYVKDGLLPLTEWLGPSPWRDRMLELVDAVLDHASIKTPVGLVPAVDHEVGGEMMQVLSRLFWMTGKEEYRTAAFRLADYFLLHALPTEQERLSLDDHGCEVIGGLSEVYLLAAETDPARRTRYRKPLHELLDRILDIGRNPEGLFYMRINPVTGEVLHDELTDNWGYDYNAFLTVAKVDNHAPYREAVRFALENLYRSRGYPWEGGSADGYADSIEGALNLLNRVPVASAFTWIDNEIETMFTKQQDDGIIEGWHGDGNFARTALMYALWKTQGCRIDPWRADVSFGAIWIGEELWLSVRSKWPWKGRLILDRPRHREYFHLPSDYPRLNQFPEWFTAEKNGRYMLVYEGGRETIVYGKDLWQGVLIHSPGGDNSGVRIRVIPNPDSSSQSERRP